MRRERLLDRVNGAIGEIGVDELGAGEAGRLGDEGDAMTSSTSSATAAVPGVTASLNQATNSSEMPRSTTLAVTAPAPVPTANPPTQPTGPPRMSPNSPAHMAPESAERPGEGSIVS